jgi:hypothetical protein
MQIAHSGALHHIRAAVGPVTPALLVDVHADAVNNVFAPVAVDNAIENGSMKRL